MDVGGWGMLGEGCGMLSQRASDGVRFNTLTDRWREGVQNVQYY